MLSSRHGRSGTRLHFCQLGEQNVFLTLPRVIGWRAGKCQAPKLYLSVGILVGVSSVEAARPLKAGDAWHEGGDEWGTANSADQYSGSIFLRHYCCGHSELAGRLRHHQRIQSDRAEHFARTPRLDGARFWAGAPHHSRHRRARSFPPYRLVAAILLEKLAGNRHFLLKGDINPELSTIRFAVRL